MTKHFTRADFDKEVIEASKTKPVLVDFFATWCGPCQLMGPIIDELENTVGDKAVVGKIDTGEEAELSEKYDIMSIPTVLIFKDGKIAETMLGLQSKEALESAIKKYY